MTKMGSTQFESKNYTASEIVTANMIDYAVDTSINKIAHQFDGLKVVQRRVLWTMKDYLDDIIDSDMLVSKTKMIHTSGDASIADVVIRMNQGFSMGVPLLEIQGNGGMYGGTGGGAKRYTSIIITDIAKDLFYTKVHMATIPMKQTDHFNSTEPTYFIPRLPTALLLYIMTIGTGAKSQHLPLNFSNVCELVKRTAEFKERNRYTTMSFKGLEPYFIPDIPIKNTIRNIDSLLENYKIGKFNTSVALEGCVDLFKDKIIVRTSPFGIPLQNTKEALLNDYKSKTSLIKENKADFVDSTSEKSEGKLVLPCRDTLNAFNNFREKLIKFNTSITPLYNLISKRGTIVNLPPPQLIEQWYHERRNSVIGGVKHSLVDAAKSLLTRETLLIVHEHCDDIVSILRDRKNVSREVIVDTLMHKYKISLPRVEVLMNMRLDQLTNLNKDKLISDVVSLRQKAKDLASTIDKADEIIYSDAELLQKKYSKPRISKITDYKGYIQLKDNIIQFDTFEEAVSLLSNFEGSRIFTYKSPKTKKRCFYKDKKAENMNPSKIFKGLTILEYFDDSSAFMWMKDKKNTISKGEITRLDPNLVGRGIHISNTFIGITKLGELVKLHTSEHSQSRRKTQLDDLIYAVPNEQNLVVVYMNTKENNTIYFSKIDTSNPKIHMNRTGATEFLGYINLKYGEDIIFNMPEFTVNNFKYLRVKNIKKLMGDNKISSVVISRMSPRNNIVRSMVEV